MVHSADNDLRMQFINAGCYLYALGVDDSGVTISALLVRAGPVAFGLAPWPRIIVALCLFCHPRKIENPQSLSRGFSEDD